MCSIVACVVLLAGPTALFGADTVLCFPGDIGVDGPAAAHMGSEGTETGTFHQRGDDTDAHRGNPDLLRRAAAAWVGDTANDDYTRRQLRNRANCLERPLPTKPGWYPTVVVERGEEFCRGAMIGEDGCWHTPRRVDGHQTHSLHKKSAATIRWAELGIKTPGQTLWETGAKGVVEWSTTTRQAHDHYERLAAAVLAAHGTSTLAPVGDSPEPGTVESIRAERDGKTPGQTLWETGARAGFGGAATWGEATSVTRDIHERRAAAVLAAHGTPTLTDTSLTDDAREEKYGRGWNSALRFGLTPVSEHPEPGTRGLLPVEVGSEGCGWEHSGSHICSLITKLGRTVLIDPRPDGAI